MEELYKCLQQYRLSPKLEGFNWFHSNLNRLLWYTRGFPQIRNKYLKFPDVFEHAAKLLQIEFVFED